MSIHEDVAQAELWAHVPEEEYEEPSAEDLADAEADYLDMIRQSDFDEYWEPYLPGSDQI